MFLDASVLVAAIAREPEAASIKTAALDAAALVTSPIAVFETSSRLAKLLGLTIVQAYEIVIEFLADADVTLAVIDATTNAAAHLCASRYHHLTGHPARLNMGDCFAYAAAKTAGLKLAYKGDDFIHTDIDGVRFGP